MEKRILKTEYLYGINTISSLINVNSGNRKIYKIISTSSKSSSQRINELILSAKKKNIQVEIVSPDIFTDLSEVAIAGSKNLAEESGSIQGIVASVSSYNYPDLEEELASGIYSGKDSILVILDEITDVGNFGAILRNCSAFGADGVIISKNRSVEVNNRVSKISSGALEEIKVYCVTNIVSTMNKLKEKGFWIYGTSLGEDKIVRPADSVDYVFPLAVVLGSEQKGIGRLVSENCDMLVKIPMAGRMQSLNVSTSSGIILYILNQFLLKKVKKI